MFTSKTVATVIAATIGSALLFTGCAAPLPPNRAACTAYAVAFNRMADVARATNDGSPNVDFTSALKTLPAAIKRAQKEASGYVLDRMQSSSGIALWLASEIQNPDAGDAFFNSSRQVVAACKAAGTPIKLHDLRSTI